MVIILLLRTKTLQRMQNGRPSLTSSFYQPMSHIGSEVGATVLCCLPGFNPNYFLSSFLSRSSWLCPVLSSPSLKQLQTSQGKSPPSAARCSSFFMTLRCFFSDNGDIKRDELRRP